MKVVELQVRLDAPPASVFRFFVEPERYVRWQGVQAELDPTPGGLFRVVMVTGDVARGEFVEVDEPRRIVLTWGFEGNPDLPPGSTTVEFTLDADGDGTLLSLRHEGLPDDAAAAMHDGGWRLYTGQLAGAVTTGA